MSGLVKESGYVHGAAVIQDPTGLHARPAVKLTKSAKRHGAEVEVRAGEAGNWVNAKSPNAVMKLKAGPWRRPAVLQALTAPTRQRPWPQMVSLVERDFQE